MLRFSDFSHLPEVDGLVQELIAEPAGLILVAGPDGRPQPPGSIPTDYFLPSGRATIFRILTGEILDAHPRARCVVVSEDRDVLHVARRFKQRIEFILVQHPLTYESAIQSAAMKRPGLLVVDRLTPDNLNETLTVAGSGTRVISQLDTIYHGALVVRQLLDYGVPGGALAALRWILTVQRFPALCQACRQTAEVDAAQLALLAELQRRHGRYVSATEAALPGSYYEPGICPGCQSTGRQGDVAAFDFFRADEPPPELVAQQSRLSLEAYVWFLAQRGQLALGDSLNFSADQMRRAYNQVMSTEQRLASANAALERKVAELETANRVLQQRTRELVSLEDIGQALITSGSLMELASRVARRAADVCKADRCVLYYLRTGAEAEVLGLTGWESESLGRRLDRERLAGLPVNVASTYPYPQRPPGLAIPADSPPLRGGLAVPLIAEGVTVGLMIIQSTRKAQFAPGEVALLQTLASSAAVAMQRAGLVDDLRTKVNALEAAQADLRLKERLERELELARQVQQSMLPVTFPEVAGLSFAANNAPARQVGGDFYDVISLDEGRVALVIADVADKGMPAALYMALARSLILAETHHEGSVAAVLRHVNQLLLELGQPNMFVTVFYGVLDRASGRLTYSRAGHDHPFLLRDGAAHMLPGRGMALGLFEDDIFYVEEETVDVAPGDRLVLYTDGLTDVTDPDGAMLERNRLERLLLSHAAKRPAELCTAVFAELRAFQRDAPQFDDMALVVVAVD